MAANFFVGIGSAKSGTSWLAEYLREHPEVAMSPIKELHYFDAKYCSELCGHWDDDWRTIQSELLAKIALQSTPQLQEKLRCVSLRLEMIRDQNTYKQYFEHIIQPGHRAFGEITPSYSMLPANGFSGIESLYPGAKYIFIMRDPVERYLSHIRFTQKMQAAQGRAIKKDFDANRQAREKLSNVQFMRRADYTTTIETLLSITDEENLCVLFYENLFDEKLSRDELGRLCDFLDIDFRTAQTSIKINATDAVSFSEEVRRAIREHFSPIYDFIHHKYDSRVPACWQ